MKLVKTLVIGLLTAFLTTNANAGDYKLKIHNAYPAKLKVKWYCKGRHKDSDTYPVMQPKTRQLSSSKCRDRSDLTVKLMIQGTGGYLNMNGYFQPNAYKNVFPKFSGANSDKGVINYLDKLSKNTLKDIYKANYLTEIKFDKIPGNGDKRCVIVTADAVMGSLLYSIVGLPMPAMYPKAGSC